MTRAPHSKTEMMKDVAYIRKFAPAAARANDPDLFEELSAVAAGLAMMARCNNHGAHFDHCPKNVR